MLFCDDLYWDIGFWSYCTALLERYNRYSLSNIESKYSDMLQLTLGALSLKVVAIPEESHLIAPVHVASQSCCHGCRVEVFSPENDIKKFYH